MTPATSTPRRYDALVLILRHFNGVRRRPGVNDNGMDHSADALPYLAPPK